MQKGYIYLLCLLLSACYSECGTHQEFYQQPIQQVYYAQPIYVVVQPAYYVRPTYVVAQPSVSYRYIERRGLAPEIYDPHPLPPLKIHNLHRSNSRHYVKHHGNHKLTKIKQNHYLKPNIHHENGQKIKVGKPHKL